MTSIFGSRRLAFGMLLASAIYATVMLLLVVQPASAHHVRAVREDNQIRE